MSRYHRVSAALPPTERWYHGTSAPDFSRFRPGEAYLTDDPAEAMGFAEGGHLGGSTGGEPRVLEVSLAPGGPVTDATDEVDFIVMDEHPELDDIDGLMARLRAEGARYADFTHPGFGGEDIRVRVSLHPEKDLEIVPARSASGGIPARTDKGLDVLVDAVVGDIQGSVTVTDSATGRQIGTLDFEHVSDEWHRVKEVDVDEGYRRQGVATLMYDWVERTLGKSLLPSDDQSDDATGFWTDRIGPYDPLDDDHGFDEETTASLARSAASMSMERAIESRGVRADALLDALDLADDLTGAGAEVSPDGIVTLYHRTDSASAEEIARTGRMFSKEDRLFFGTDPHGEQISGHGDTAIRVRMPLERLELQSVMPNEAFVTVMSRSRPVLVDAEVVAEMVAARTEDDDVLPEDSSDQSVLSAPDLAAAATRKYGDKAFGGNCGQFALGLARFLKDAGVHPDPRIGLIHDGTSETEEELRDGEPDIYHVFLQLGGAWYDATGKIDRRHLTDFAAAEYGDPHPDFMTDLPPDENTRRIISYNTAWDIEWTDFYRFFEKASKPRKSRTAWSRDTLNLDNMCTDCGSDLDIAGRIEDGDDLVCRGCHRRRTTPPPPQEKPRGKWWRWTACTASALDHGPTFRDWQTKARRTIQDAFSGVEEDDESDWLAIAKSALAATLPHIMYRGFSVPAATATEAERLGAATTRAARRAVPHSFSKAVAKSFAVGVEPAWAAAGAVSDDGRKHRGKAGQWGVIVSVSVGPDMVDWSCLDDGDGIFGGEQVYDHLPFDKPVGEAIADMLIKSGGTHNAEWDLRVNPYPPKSANMEVFQLAPGDTDDTEAMWRKWESEWETRDAARAAFRITAWWSREMLDHKLARLDLEGRDAMRFRALCETFLGRNEWDELYDMCYWAASFLGVACRELGVPMRVATGMYTPEDASFGHAWLEDASGTPFDITAVAHAEHRRQTRSGDMTGVAAFCPDCGKMNSAWNRAGDCECVDPPDPVERTKRFSDEDEMMEAGYECVERDSFPEWVPGFVGPDRYDGVSGDEAEENASQLGFDEGAAEDAKEMAREVMSAEGRAARRAAAGAEAEIEVIATDVRRRLGVDHELEDGEAPKALCLDFARGLADELVRRGYSAGVTQGLFEVDWPDEEAYEDWDEDDFEADDGDEDGEDEDAMNAEEVMGQAMHFPLHYWVRVTAKGGKPIGPVYVDITADQFDDECKGSFDPVWVWTGETERHQSQRHDFGVTMSPQASKYHRASREYEMGQFTYSGPLREAITNMDEVIQELRDEWDEEFTP